MSPENTSTVPRRNQQGHGMHNIAPIADAALEPIFLPRDESRRDLIFKVSEYILDMTVDEVVVFTLSEEEKADRQAIFLGARLAMRNDDYLVGDNPRRLINVMDILNGKKKEAEVEVEASVNVTDERYAILRKYGLCSEPKKNLDIFYPADGLGNGAAITVCDQCGLKGLCLEVALDNKEDFGVWGGKSERARRKMRKQRVRQKRIDLEKAAMANLEAPNSTDSPETPESTD